MSTERGPLDDPPDLPRQRTARDLPALSDEADRPASVFRYAMRQARDFTNPQWPPTWLRVAARAASAVLTLFMFTIALNAATHLWLILSESRLSQFVVRPMDTYFVSVATRAEIPAQHLLTCWSVGGFLVWVAAVAGSIGGRICWPLYGALTSIAVWQSAASETRIFAVSVTAMLWSIMSIFCFGRTRRRRIYDNPYSYHGRSTSLGGVVGRWWRWLVAPLDAGFDTPIGEPLGGSRAAEARGAAMQRQVDQVVKDLAFTSVGEYLTARCTTSIRDIATELGLTPSFVNSLRHHYFPPAPGTPIGRVPYQIKQEAADLYRKGDVTYASLAKRYGASPATVSKWVKEYTPEVSVMSTATADSGADSDEISAGQSERPNEPD